MRPAPGSRHWHVDGTGVGFLTGRQDISAANARPAACRLPDVKRAIPAIAHAVQRARFSNALGRHDWLA